MNHERKIPGEWSLARWLLLGIFGIALAVAIALAAGNLANQPVGISGEPVSAGSALEPPSDNGSSGAAKSTSSGTGSGGNSSGGTSSPDTSGTATSGTGTAAAPVAPPVAPPAQPAPPVATGGDDYASGTDQPSGPDDSSNGGEKESGDD